MVDLAADSTLDLVFGALSDPTRRAILHRLTLGSATVSELAAPFQMSLPAISKHLRALEKAGLIVRTKEGRVHHLRLVPERIHEASLWLEYYRRFWEPNLDSLAEFLSTTVGDESSDEPTT